MIEDILAKIFVSQWVVLIFVSVLLPALAELGYRFGYSLHQKNADAAEEQSGSVQGAVLEMLAL